ncbi:MAG: general secretion pathway protein GspL [Gallionella sp.]|nr:general secretion pathway protein GspL [Gallionella sp.]
MSTLLLRIPARALTDTASDPARLPCAYTLRTQRDVVERSGQTTLGELGATIRDAKRVVLLIAAADVSVLRLAVPPLSAAKLRVALPNLIEDRLLDDAVECVMACSSATDGKRDVAVMQRAWLTRLLQSLHELGARRVSALPEQLCLAHHDGQATAVISEYGNGCALALRLSEHEGLGMVQHTPEELLHSLRGLVPASALTVYVPPGALSRYQTLLAQDARVTVRADDGAHWQVPDTAPDLATGLGMRHQSQWNWRPWRWPLALAALLLLVNTFALDFDWWRMNREAAKLRADMKHIYLAAYPKESVILDPLLQMRQKIAAAQHDSGIASADDFTALAAGFGQAWTSAMPDTGAAISGIEYREGSLWIRLKSAAPVVAIKSALAERKLALEIAPGSDLTWQIRSAK